MQEKKTTNYQQHLDRVIAQQNRVLSFCQGIENPLIMATNETSGSGVLDNILLSTKRYHAQITPEPGELSMDKDLLVNDEPETSTARAIHGEKRRRESPHSHGVRSSKATADFAPKTVSSTDLNSVNQKIDLLMTMMNDIAPVAKTLNKAYEDPLLTESDEDIDDSGACPPSKQTKLATDTTGPEISMGVVDSLVSEINTDEKTGPAISEKIAKALDGILSVGLMNPLPPNERRLLTDLKIVSCWQPPG